MTKQRSFTSLTEEEINQVAEWLQHGTYDKASDRIAKPRPEAFGLNLKSKRPLAEHPHVGHYGFKLAPY